MTNVNEAASPRTTERAADAVIAASRTRPESTVPPTANREGIILAMRQVQDEARKQIAFYENLVIMIDTTITTIEAFG